MHSAPQHSLVKSLTISARRPRHPLSRCQFQQRHESFHNSCHRRLPQNPQNGTDSHNTATDLDGSLGNKESADRGTSSAKSGSNGDAHYQPEQRPYGSGARRALRNRRIQEPEYFELPKWFLRYNASVYEGSGVAWPRSLRVIQKQPNSLLQRFPPLNDEAELLKANPDLTEEYSTSELGEHRQRLIANHFATEPSIELPALKTSEGAEPTRESIPPYLYSIDFYVFAELYGLYCGLMRPPNSANAQELAAEKSHLVLQFPGQGGHYFLDAIIRAMASLSGASMITINAQDVAELASGPYSNFESSFKQRAGSISYDVYKKKPAFLPTEDFLANAREEAENEVDEDSYEVPEQARGGLPAFSVATKLIDLSSKTDLESLMRWTERQSKSIEPWSRSDSETSNATSNRRDPRWKAIVEAIFSATGNQSFENGGVNREENDEEENDDQDPLAIKENWAAGGGMRDMDGNRMRHSELNRAGSLSFPTAQPIRDKADQSTRDMIIQVQDIDALERDRTGSSFLNALFEHANLSRSQGNRVMIIGTATAPRIGAVGRHVKQLPTVVEHPFCLVRDVPPALESHEDAGAFLEAEAQRICEVNWRHFIQMIQQRSNSGGFFPQWQAREIEDDSILSNLNMTSDFLRFGEIHERAMLTLGLFCQQEPDSWTQGLEDLETITRHSASVRRRASGSSASSNSLPDSLPQRERHFEAKNQESSKSEDDMIGQLAKGCNNYEKKLLRGVVEPSKIQTTFDSVYAPYDTIDALRTLTTLSIKRPEAFSYGVLATDKIPGLLMYGPPGTGKTLLAKAVAKESGARVLEVSGAEIFDMYVGESEKNIRALFTLAKKLSPCVIFIDEADALFGSRSGQSGRQRSAHREVINQFLKEWDGMNNDAGSAFIMVATNRPFDLDDAVLRRLPRRILVDLPTEKDRLEILKIHLKDEAVEPNVDLPAIAKQTPFYSGSDLKNLCVAAALNCVKEENRQASEHQGEEAYKYPEKRVLTVAYFEKALNEITASISEDMNSLKDIKKFDEQYGDKRNNRKKPRSWGFKTPVEDERRDTVKIRELA
ncbi:MAG: hypothetical protein Q9160_001939 [Pyrenula sp. 1 TL-2023]